MGDVSVEFSTGSPVNDRFLSYVLRADSLSLAANAAAMALGNEMSRPHAWRSSTQYAPEALGAATIALGAAVNAFQALRLLTFPRGLLAPDGSVEAAVITVNGTAGLLRQAVECAALADWLLQARTDRQHQERGFAYVWKDIREHLAYVRSLSAGKVAPLERRQETLIEEGRHLDLLVPVDRNPGWAPRVALGDASGLLRAKGFPDDYFSGLAPEEISSLGRNGEWLYRWLSGMAHGLNWVHPFGESGEGDATVSSAFTSPLYFPLMMSADLAIRLITDVTNNLVERGRQVPS